MFGRSSRSDRISVTNGELEAVALGSSYINIGYNGKTIRSLINVKPAVAVNTLTDLYLDSALPATLK